jgi:hypothetical protein
MALGVDLFGMDADGKVAWHWVCRRWSGFDVLDLVAPSPAEPPPAWEGPITAEQIDTLRAKVGGREAEREWQDPDLDALLSRAGCKVVVRVEEWGGYGE